MRSWLAAWILLSEAAALSERQRGQLANHLTVMDCQETTRTFNELASIGSSSHNWRFLGNHGNLIGHTVYQYIWANGKGKCKSTNNIFSHLIGCLRWCELLVLIQKILIFLRQKSIFFKCSLRSWWCLLKTSPREFSHINFFVDTLCSEISAKRESPGLVITKWVEPVSSNCALHRKVIISNA